MEQNENQKTLRACDISNITYISSESNRSLTRHEFTAEIDGKVQPLHYEITSHYDGYESFEVHTDENDIHNRMTEMEMHELDKALEEKVTLGIYTDKIMNAGSIKDLDNIHTEYSKVIKTRCMDSGVAGRLNEAYAEKACSLESERQTNVNGFDKGISIEDKDR